MCRKLGTMVAILLLGALAFAQQDSSNANPAGTTATKLSGKQLYTSYCSLCHGTDGKGGGAFSPQLKTWPPDLTILSRENGGVFPVLHIAEIIDGEFDRPAHGSREMPIWGPIFRSIARGRLDSAQRRIDRLVNYLESIQQK